MKSGRALTACALVLISYIGFAAQNDNRPNDAVRLLDELQTAFNARELVQEGPQRGKLAVSENAYETFQNLAKVIRELLRVPVLPSAPPDIRASPPAPPPDITLPVPVVLPPTPPETLERRAARLRAEDEKRKGLEQAEQKRQEQEREQQEREAQLIFRERARRLISEQPGGGRQFDAFSPTLGAGAVPTAFGVFLINYPRTIADGALLEVRFVPSTFASVFPKEISVGLEGTDKADGDKLSLRPRYILTGGTSLDIKPLEKLRVEDVASPMSWTWDMEPMSDFRHSDVTVRMFVELADRSGTSIRKTAELKAAIDSVPVEKIPFLSRYAPLFNIFGGSLATFIIKELWDRRRNRKAPPSSTDDGKVLGLTP